MSDVAGTIESLNYDLVTNVMSSFKSENHRQKKLRFEENVEITSDKIISNLAINKKTGFIKADQLIYFKKKDIDYFVLGRVSDELFEKLILLIKTLSDKGKLKNNINNLIVK